MKYLKVITKYIERTSRGRHLAIQNKIKVYKTEFREYLYLILSYLQKQDTQFLRIMLTFGLFYLLEVEIMELRRKYREGYQSMPIHMNKYLKEYRENEAVTENDVTAKKLHYAYKLRLY